MIEALVFGFDGILVDSLESDVRLWLEVLPDYGVEELTAGDLRLALIGKSPQDFLNQLSTEVGFQLGLGAIDDYENLLATKLHELYRPHAKVQELLSALKLPFAVATNCRSRAFELKARGAGIMDWVAGKGFCSDLHIQPKPSSELYDVAMKFLGVEPYQCLAVEDSAIGVVAAKAAGMDVVGVSSVERFKNLRENKADFTITDIKHLPVIIEAVSGTALDMELCV